MTKTEFIAAYRDYIVKNCGGPDNPTFEGLLASVRITLFTDRITWCWDEPASKAAWKAIGGKGKMTLKALRAMKENTDG